MSETSDRDQVRRSAIRVGLAVGAASAVIVGVGVGVLIAVILLTARPERSPGDGVAGGGDRDIDHIVVDVDRVLPWVIALGVAGVCLLAVVAWFAARRSVGPLADALRMQRNFVSDASHELRTPLTALSSRIQILQRRHERGEPIEETIGDLRRNAGTMDDVLTDLLLSAEAAALQSGAPADVSACIHAAVESLRPLAADRGATIAVDVDGIPLASIPAVTLTRLCVALIDNAVAHAPAGSATTVAACATGGSAEVRVSDLGRGVGLEDQARIFGRFARGTETGHRRGFGLGLSLVRDVAARYGGTVEIETTSPEGTTFLLRIPSA